MPAMAAFSDDGDAFFRRRMSILEDDDRGLVARGLRSRFPGYGSTLLRFRNGMLVRIPGRFAGAINISHIICAEVAAAQKKSRSEGDDPENSTN